MASYTVRSGQNLSQIARAAGISVIDLVAANPQIADPDLIHPGQKINLPSGRQSATARNTAAQRIASGSFSAGSFSATGVPGEGLMEVGQFRFGPGGGFGAKAQGKTFAQIMGEQGVLPGRGAPSVGSVDQPVSVDGVAPSIAALTEEALEQARKFDIALDPAFEKKLTAGAVTLEDVLPKSTFRAFQHRMGIARSPRRGLTPGSGIQEGSGGRLPTAPTDDEAAAPRLTLPPDVEAMLASRGRGTNRKIGGVDSARFSPNMTHAERVAVQKEMIANGLAPGEALRLLHSITKPPYDPNFQFLVNLISDPVQRFNVDNRIQSALINTLGQNGAMDIMKQIDKRYLPLSITDDQIATFQTLVASGLNPNRAMSMATRDYGLGVMPDDDPQAIANRQTTPPEAMTHEEAVHRGNNPITPGEHRFTYQTGSARPDTLLGQQRNWDMNAVISASYILFPGEGGGLRGDEIASVVEDGLKILKALADKEDWAYSVVANTLKDFPLSSTQRRHIEYLMGLIGRDQAALLEFDDILAGGRDAVIAWLEDEGLIHNAGDIWTDPNMGGSGGIASLLGSGLAPFGSYLSPDYPGGTGGGGGTGSGGGIGASRGTALYQWRISAPSVS